MSLHRIHLTQRTISLESSTLSNAVAAAVGRLEGFFGDTKDFIASLNIFSSEPLSITVSKSKVIPAIKEAKYTSLMPIKIFKPSGMTSTYLDTLKAFKLSEGNVLKYQKEVLEPFNRWLLIVLSNPQKLSSFVGSKTIDGFHIHEFDDDLLRLNKYFSGKESDTEGTFGSLFARNADYEASAILIDELNKNVLGMSMLTIKNLITNIAVNCDKLVVKLNEKPDEYKISGNTMKSLVEITYHMAKEAEFVSIYCYLLKSLLQSFKDSEEHLEKVLNLE